MKMLKDTFYFLLKIAILSGIVAIATSTAKAQDKTFIPNGYQIDYPHLYYTVDTIKNEVQARIYYHGKHFVNVRHGTTYTFEKDIPTYYGKPFTFKYKKGSVIIITRKNFRKEYRI